MLKRNLHTFFLLTFLCLVQQSSALLWAEGNPKVNKLIVSRSFKEDLNQKYSGKNFDYSLTKPRESLWEQFKTSLRNFISRIFDFPKPKKVEEVIDWLLYLLSIIIFSILFYHLRKYILQKEGNFFLSKENKKILLKERELIEDIHEIDFGKAIAQYETEKNYRWAFRYRFLALLKHLSDVKKIQWTPEKTNDDYLKELSSATEREQFRQAAYIFEHIWYGDFSIDNHQYHAFVEKIEPLKNQQLWIKP